MLVPTLLLHDVSGDVYEMLDASETLHRRLSRLSSAELGLSETEFGDLRRDAQIVYLKLSQMRHLVDEGVAAMRES